ncbi:Metallo-hydrolase/oxidoreductase superfamily protein isoform 1 [Hibiscus syriacus]|uniref:Metallo-hydrolase/oxidoreductase superfamily protein isoform 1 n=1 Tax=Hibiscus syriacus TaxID=106335 RepID=A0A6A3CRR8_HIBSY|nr:Metallo-hydrolase/oxidoreductase superfamily protein isoform 1 [Hibiscus syriacus]
MASFVVVLGTFTLKLLVIQGSSPCFLKLNRFSPPLMSSPYSYILSNFGFRSSLPHPPFNSSLGSKTSIRALDDNGTLHSVTDDQELMRRAIVVCPNVTESSGNLTPKVAFMFLSRGSLPLAPLWEKFFLGHEGLYSIYIHTSSDFIDEPPVTSVFYKRKPVQWGSVTIVDAERRLLANALLDCANVRFVLLSEACIPLFNFTTVYNYLINTNQSFIGSFGDPRPTGRGRYNKRMLLKVSLADWQKGSQWFEMNITCQLLSTKSRRSLTRIGASLGSIGRKAVHTPHNMKFHPNTLEPLLRMASALFGFNESNTTQEVKPFFDSGLNEENPVYNPLNEPRSCIAKNNAIRISTEPESSKNWDYEINGYFPERDCTIVDFVGNIVAQTGVKKEVEEVMASKDLYHVVVKPGIDQAFVFGVIAVLDYIHGESARC